MASPGYIISDWIRQDVLEEADGEVVEEITPHQRDASVISISEATSAYSYSYNQQFAPDFDQSSFSGETANNILVSLSPPEAYNRTLLPIEGNSGKFFLVFNN